MFTHYKFAAEITEASNDMMIKALFLTYITPTLRSDRIPMEIRKKNL